MLSQTIKGNGSMDEETLERPAWRVRKKWIFTWAVFAVGVWIALRPGSDVSLSDWLSYATVMLGVAGATDVTDKKLNGGK